MPAEFITDDTGARVLVGAPAGPPPEPPYIRYAPWEPTTGYDLRTLAERVADVEQRLARLEGVALRSEGEL